MNQTLDKLDTLGLFGMPLGLREQFEGSQYLSLSFDERFGLLVDRETEARDTRRLALRLKTAKLRQWLGHERLDTVRIYSQPDEVALERAAAALESQERRR